MHARRAIIAALACAGCDASLQLRPEDFACDHGGPCEGAPRPAPPEVPLEDCTDSGTCSRAGYRCAQLELTRRRCVLPCDKDRFGADCPLLHGCLPVTGTTDFACFLLGAPNTRCDEVRGVSCAPPAICGLLQNATSSEGLCYEPCRNGCFSDVGDLRCGVEFAGLGTYCGFVCGAVSPVPCPDTLTCNDPVGLCASEAQSGAMCFLSCGRTVDPAHFGALSCGRGSLECMTQDLGVGKTRHVCRYANNRSFTCEVNADGAQGVCYGEEQVCVL